MKDVTYRVSYLKQGIEKYNFALTQQKSLLKSDELRQYLNEKEYSFYIREDWRQGKLFDVQLEVFSDIIDIDEFIQLLSGSRDNG